MNRIFVKFLVVMGLVGGIPNNIEAQISTQPVNDTICLGDDAEFIVVVNNSADTSYQWQLYDGSNWSDLSNTGIYSGVDTDTLQLTNPPIGLNNSWYRSIVTQGASSDTSDNAGLIIHENLTVSVTITADPGNVICAGTEVTFTATPENGGTSPTYQWKLNGNNVGSNSPTYSSTNLSNNDEVSCELTSSLPCTVNNPAVSDTIEMTVYDVLTAAIVNLDTTICYNTVPDTLYSGVNGGAGSYTYLWESTTDGGSTWLTVSNDSNLVFVDGLVITTQYRLTVNDGDICGPVVSDIITITVYDELLASISSDETICFNSVPDTLTSTVTGGDETYTYQWQDSPDGSAWSDISNATSDTYQPPALTSTTHYQLIVDDETCTPVTTNAVTITVYDELLASIAAGQTICYNTTPNQLTSSVTGGDETYTYQWQDSPDGSSWTDIPGAISDTYQPPALIITTHYQLIVDDETCTPVTTNAVTITVYDELLASIAADQTICSNTAPDLLTSTVSGGDGTYTYQWQDSPDGSTWADISGAISETSQPPALTATTHYQLIVDDETCSPATTDFVTITINPNVSATVSILAKNTTCDNETVIFTISDTLNGGNNPGFEWFLNEELQSTGVSWSSLVSDNDEVYARMTSTAECVNNNPVNSDPVIMTVKASPVLLNNGNLVPKPLDNPVVLICVDSSETNTYSWFENGVEIPSANEQFYYPRKYGLTFKYDAEYYVRIENDEFCSSNSNSYIYAFDKSALFEGSEVFLVYPNPNNGNFSLVLNKEVVPEDFESCTLRIFDVTGKIVLREEIFKIDQNIELQGVRKGLYFMEVIISETQHQIRKLILE